jgi:hypothetical protein
MSARLCLICRRPGEDYHHWTGDSLDPDLGFWLCHDHHELMNDDWNTADVPAKRPRDGGEQQGPATFLHGLQLRLCRLAMLMGRLAERGVFEPLTRALGVALARWASRLKTCLHALDEYAPGWQNASGIGESGR